MPEITRFSGHRDWIDLLFVKRERTPQSARALGIQSHLAGVSLSNTVSLLADLGVQRSRKAVHDWVQKADLQPDDGRAPNQVAVDETVIRINDKQFWLYAAADPDTNDLLYVRLFSTTTTSLTVVFLRELRHKHDVDTAVFLVDGANHLQTALRRARLRFQVCPHGHRNAIERIFRELERPSLVVLELLRPRRLSHPRIVAPRLRLLVEPMLTKHDPVGAISDRIQRIERILVTAHVKRHFTPRGGGVSLIRDLGTRW